jgi:hypothetical protein
MKQLEPASLNPGQSVTSEMLIEVGSKHGKWHRARKEGFRERIYF